MSACDHMEEGLVDILTELNSDTNDLNKLREHLTAVAEKSLKWAGRGEEYFKSKGEL